ncbi:NudC domain-containing protein 3 [Lemmus lemmus]
MEPGAAELFCACSSTFPTARRTSTACCATLRTTWAPLRAAQALVLQVFKTFLHMARQDGEKRKKKLEEKIRRKEEAKAVAAATIEKEAVPVPVQEVEIDATADLSGPREVEKLESPGPQGPEHKVANGLEEAEAPGTVNSAAEGPKDSPVLPRIQEQFQKNPDSYNGAIRGNYTWSQDYTDLEVRVASAQACGEGEAGLCGP